MSVVASGSPPNPVSRGALRALFSRYGFRPRRSLGQTFLVDANVVAKIIAAAELTGGESVLEIGPGAGAVTKALVERARRVVAIEVDPKLTAILMETVGAAVEVVQADVLAVDLNQVLGGGREERWRVVANLPYAITGPAIIRLLSIQDRLDGAVIMVQREVAERITALPGGRDRGLLSVLVQAAAEVKVVGRAPRTCFWPQPRVDSTMLALQMRRPPPVPAALRPAFFAVVRAGFGVRRKTMANALSHRDQLGLCREEAKRLLVSCEIEPGRRAETLSETEFLRLAEAIAARQGGAPR